MINIALIGVTGFGDVHYRALSKLEDEGQVKLAAATVIDPEEAPETCHQLEESGCRIYSDYEEMLVGEVGRCDLVSIPTGIAWHCRMTCDALKHGYHVVVEKPVAGTVAEVDQMIAAREAAGRRVFVGFHDLYLPPLNSVKKRLLAGEIGQVQSVSVQGSWPRGSGYYERNNWAGRVKVGESFVYDSPANNALAHYLMASLFLVAKEFHQAASVTSGEGELYRAKPIESFDTMSVRLQTDADVEVLFTLTHSGATPAGPLIIVQGEKGRMVWRFNNGITVEPAGDNIPTPAGPQCQIGMFREVASALESGEPMGCSLEMAREHTRLINALHDHCPIHTIGPEHCQEYPDRELIAVNGMEAAVLEAGESHKLFSELGYPWATPASQFTL